MPSALKDESLYSEEKSSVDFSEEEKWRDQGELSSRKSSASFLVSPINHSSSNFTQSASIKAVTDGTTRQATREREKSRIKQTESAEMFQDVLRKINSLGDRGRPMLRKLMDEIDAQGTDEGDMLRRLVNDTMNDERLSSEAKRRRKRELILSSSFHQELTEDDKGDPPLEEVSLLA